MKLLLILVMVSASCVCYSQDITNPIDSTTTTISVSPVRAVKYANALIIVDNKEVSHDDLAKIDPHQIKTINVLKDSASTAKYGEKGRLGVILIELAQNSKPTQHKKRSTIE
jgi:hypothetical protein